MGIVGDRQTLTFEGWPAGVDNRSPLHEVGASRVRVARNVDFTALGKIRRRAGYQRLVPAAQAHSLWGNERWLLCALDGDLVALGDGVTVLAAGVGARLLSYAALGGKVWISDGVQLRRLGDDGVLSAAWPDTPTLSAAPVATATGGLPAGQYQVAVTGFDSDGRESGAQLAGIVDVAEGGGIALTGVAFSPDVVRARFYLTPPNGDQFYALIDLPAGLPNYQLGAGVRGRLLETQHMFPLPAGHAVAAFNGRLFSAVGSTLWFSEPFRYGLTRPENYVRFDGRIDLLASAGPEGLYVAAGKRTYFHDGGNPAQWRRTIVAPHGAVPNSATVVDIGVFGLDELPSGQAVVWMGQDGQLRAGTSSGQVLPLYRQHATAFAGARHGATMLRDRDGLTQIVSSLQGGTAPAAMASDVLTATVYRHGVPLGD